MVREWLMGWLVARKPVSRQNRSWQQPKPHSDSARRDATAHQLVVVEGRDAHVALGQNPGGQRNGKSEKRARGVATPLAGTKRHHKTRGKGQTKAARCSRLPPSTHISMRSMVAWKKGHSSYIIWSWLFLPCGVTRQGVGRRRSLDSAINEDKVTLRTQQNPTTQRAPHSTEHSIRITAHLCDGLVQGLPDAEPRRQDEARLGPGEDVGDGAQVGDGHLGGGCRLVVGCRLVNWLSDGEVVEGLQVVMECVRGRPGRRRRRPVPV